MSHYTNVTTDKDNNNKSTKTTASRARIENISKDVNKMTKAFTTVNTQLRRLKEADSDLAYSEE